MIEDKLKSLKKALLYSYQAGTMIIENPNKEEKGLPYLEFRCLMNPDKRTFDTDKMMLSVPFEDICLNAPRIGRTSDGFVPVPIKCGRTFIWKETSSRWIPVLQYIEEYAYFRADVRRCYEFPIEIDGKQYYFASVGENEEILEWRKHNREEWNKMNYTRTLYLERNEETFNYFKRFKIIKVPNIFGELESWEVQAVAPNSTDDILIVHLKEYFENPYLDISESEKQKEQERHELDEDFVCTVYDSIEYTTKYIENAVWSIENKTPGLNIEIKDAIVRQNNTTIYIQLMNGKTGEFDLYYNNVKVKHIVIKPL
ncbi:MAG TPA: hypothetical protein DCL29_06905 [Eubacterium sp.]|nr:hypothetical protein [Eubacterium sp.]